ncbi:GNAT family N-acetyltransferase [Rossellomorea vietnamensis]|uniref:GNAT family N-acetyltransferase n=1 Tax=Rossellomorea vietnamensis TaxID=218284 RepID=A0ACD4C8T2_9BACI|nr:GNAT family N-acetyltransferase [Rossellomorea vietnamensis]UXH44821.1 GNAT family N-acetyltransferase [Rossellomorea vietnamensis]
MLTSTQLQDIRDLQDVCEDFEGINLKLNWEMLKKRKNDQDDFLLYKDGRLVGFLGIYGFGDSYEICGMIHPQFRRQHLFQELFQEALHSLNSRTVNTLLLNIPGSSTSGKGFISHMDAVYDFTEYEMKWNKKELIIDSDSVGIKTADKQDIETIIDLDETCFGVVRSDAESYTKRLFEESREGNLMIIYDEKVVGKIRVQRADKKSFIYGFAVFPSFQGKGIGRNALSQVVMQESKWTDDIYLDVAAANSKALNLYESSGFQTFYSQEYYRYPIK